MLYDAVMAKRRWQEQNIKEALKVRRVVMLIGSRQCGKTTLAQHVVSKNSNYVTLDDTELLKNARSDPAGFVRHNKQTMIIDEIQKAPELISEIKRVIDKDTRYGQYLITGSADIHNLPTVKESLAGRVSKIRLRPFTYGEFLENEPKFLNRLTKKEFVNNKDLIKKDVIEIAMRGGFPEPLMRMNSTKLINRWYSDYINTLVDKDLKAQIISVNVGRGLAPAEGLSTVN